MVIPMRHIACILLFLLGLSGVTSAQTYSLATENRPYQDLQNDTVLSDTQWVAKQYPIVLPFPLRVANANVTNIWVDTDGRIRRRVTTGGFTSFRTVAWGFGNCGLRQKEGDVSRISWVMEGQSPNRIAKVQFKNAGFVGDDSHSDKVNFQIWMHEDGKRIEVVFGPVATVPMRALNGAYGPFLGIGSQYVRGTPAAPLLGTQDFGLNGIPSEGQVFRFWRP